MSIYKFLFFAFFVVVGCSTSQVEKLITVQGRIMGTTYSVKIPASDPGIRTEIQGFLENINSQVSTYESNSIISIINRSDSCVDLNDYPSDHFQKVMDASQEVFENTNGYFDPTIGPLVDYWGFGVEKYRVEEVDSSIIQELLEIVNFDDVQFNNQQLFCKKEGQQLNLNAIAKGYAVDQLVEYLQKYQFGVVEIGGETRVFGEKPDQSPWTIGINTPNENASTQDIIKVLHLQNQSVATSGDYRSFYESNGRKFTHIINPHSGFPEESSLVSVTVIHNQCMIADGYATGLLACGLQEGLRIANQVDDIEAFFIYFNEEGQYQFAASDGFNKYLVE